MAGKSQEELEQFRFETEMIVQVIEGEVRKREAMEKAVYGSQVGKGHKYPRVANPIRDRASSNDLMSRIKKLDVFATNTSTT